MNEPNRLHELLLNYKLDRLSRAERERLEERIFGEPEFSAMLEEAEYDLLDDYRADRLAPADRERIEQAFSPEERSRAIPVSIAAEASIAAQSTPRGSRRSILLPVFALSSLAAIAVIAAIVLISGRHTRPQLSARNPGDSIPTQSAGGGNQRVKQTPQNQVATLLLTSEVVRDSSAMHLLLKPDTQTVHIQWVLPHQVKGSEFALAVAEESGAARASVESNHVASLDGQRIAEFAVSPAVFHGPNARYLLSVRGVPAPEAAIRTYRVIVERR